MFFSRIYGSEFCGMVVVVVVSTSICIGVALLIGSEYHIAV
jgi:hypothetical protein